MELKSYVSVREIQKLHSWGDALCRKRVINSDSFSESSRERCTLPLSLSWMRVLIMCWRGCVTANSTDDSHTPEKQLRWGSEVHLNKKTQ